MRKVPISILILVIASIHCFAQMNSNTIQSKTNPTNNDRQPVTVRKDWKKILSPEAFDVMVNKGTETPYQNPYWDNHEKGMYVSAATGKPLFSSDAKFESGTGWPSFYKPIDKNSISVVKDVSHGMLREEVVETSTGLHLGHVFNDGPKPTGLRYCMNSYAMKFIPSKTK